MGEEARAAGELRVDRRGHLAAPLRRDPGEGVWRAAQPRPLQGRGSGDHRRDERDARRGLGEHPDREASGCRGKSPRARDHRPQALRRLAGARHFRRAGLPRIRDAGLGRRVPAGGNAQAHRRAVVARDRGGAKNARSLGAPDRDGAAADRQHARGIRRELPQGFPQVGSADQGLGREGGMMLSAEKNRMLTQVGPGTTMGELLRRYWHPVAAVSEIEKSAIKPVRLMGEDLVVYRDLSGTYGLIARHCRHRAADLAYGYVEQCGLRCHYHGWVYDESGRCVEQPFEEKFDPQGRLKKRIRTAAYPVQAKAGLLWAYLGPEPAPLLPNWEPFSWKNGFVQVVFAEVPCNWLQCQENSIDPLHFEWMHMNWSVRLEDRLGPYSPTHLKLEFEEFDYGFTYKRLR